MAVPSTSVEDLVPLLADTARRPGHVGKVLSIDNIGRSGDHEVLESSAEAKLMKALAVPCLRQDIFHVSNRLSETLRNSHRLFRLACWLLRKVRLSCVS